MNELTARVANNVEAEELKARLFDVSNIAKAYGKVLVKQELDGRDRVMLERGHRYLEGMVDYVAFVKGEEKIPLKDFSENIWYSRIFYFDRDLYKWFSKKGLYCLDIAQKVKEDKKVGSFDLKTMVYFWMILKDVMHLRKESMVV